MDADLHFKIAVISLRVSHDGTSCVCALVRAQRSNGNLTSSGVALVD